MAVNLHMVILLFIYDLLLAIGFFLYLPFYIKNKKITARALKQKLSFFGKNEFYSKEAVWIQVVSVGEVNLIEKFIKRLALVLNSPIIITTTTLTGNILAKKKYSNFAKIAFFPLDLSFIVQRFISAIKPKVFIAVETEIWPNLFYRLNHNHIPILIVNARISDKAFKRYKLISPIISRFINLSSAIGVQNNLYRNRFISLGTNPDKIKISGNMKFESVEVDTQKLNTLRKQYLPYLKKETNKLLICGSTHYPEEEIILDIYKEICEKNPTWRLLIAPRHIDRIGIIEKSISERGLSPIKISEIDQSSMGTNTVFLLDTIGELKYFYAFADICFVGGSLADYGGHNLLEPIFFAKPTIFGPHTDNFKDISRTILEKRAGILVKDRSEFKKILIELISDTQLQKEISLSCLHVFEEEKNSVEENLKLVLTCIK